MSEINEAERPKELLAPELPEAQSRDGSDLLRGCDPSSNVFPFELLAAVMRRSPKDSGVWSVAELRLTAVDRQILLAWGKLGSWDFRRDGRRIQTIGSLKLGGRHAIGATFLLFCSEVARLDAVEGEMWPVVYAAMNKALRQALFTQPSLPKPMLRDATEEACRRLRVRHVFGRDGEQSWMRTVFLQFGFTRKGVERLNSWLSAPEHLPVAVEELLDTSRNLHSVSFVDMWQTLIELRWGSISRAEAEEKLKDNPWSPVEQRARMLVAAVTSRERAPGATRDGPDDGYRLLHGPRIRLGKEPLFEFTLNPCPPQWCGGERYTLEFGTRRLPISSADGHWKFDQSELLSIPLDVPRMEVDLTQRRVSVMPQKLELQLEPISSFVFYDVSSGAELESDELSGREHKGTIVLCQAEVRTRPEPEEFQMVFAGKWRLLIFREGLPEKLVLVRGEEMLWQMGQSETTADPTSRAEISVWVGNGWWGQSVRACVMMPLGGGLVAKRLMLAGQSAELTSSSLREFVGSLRLSPELQLAKAARVLCAEGSRLRSLRAVVRPVQSAGAALEGEQSWVVLDGELDLDIHWLQGRRMRVRPPLHDGEPKDPREWAILEGERLLARPRENSEVLRGLNAIGEPLALAYGPYNNQEQWHQLARSVVDSGCVRGLRAEGNDAWTVMLTQNVGFGNSHGVWVWRREDVCPQKLKKGAFETADGDIRCALSAGTVLGFGISYEGLRLGSKVRDGAWAEWRDWIRKASDWQQAAWWLRWWHAPLRHVELRSIIEERALRQPVDTIVAWLMKETCIEEVKQSEGQDESWRLMARAFLWGWHPNNTESVELLRRLDLWAGEFDRDRECANFDLLLALNPMLLAQAARRGAPIIYRGGTRRELVVLLRCLQNRILEIDDDERWEEAYRRVCADAAEDLNVDERFLERSVVDDARRYVRGQLHDGRNLKLVLGSMLMRRMVAVRLLEDTAEEWARG